MMIASQFCDHQCEILVVLNKKSLVHHSNTIPAMLNIKDHTSYITVKYFNIVLNWPTREKKAVRSLCDIVTGHCVLQQNLNLVSLN